MRRMVSSVAGNQRSLARQDSGVVLMRIKGDEVMVMEMKTIHPRPQETYRIAVDDSCLVVSSGSKPDAPKVWLSKAMVTWIILHGEQTMKEHQEHIRSM